MKNLVKERICQSIDVKTDLLTNDSLLEAICSLADNMIECIKIGGKIILCGNGGSASDALHFAGEIVGRFKQERAAWPAMTLNADVAAMTAIANDYSYSNIYARQAEGHVNAEDVFIGISTSGCSENVFRAAEVAKKKGAKTAALLGKDGGKLGKVVDYPIIVPCMDTARVQESHILIIHILCEITERKLTESDVIS